MTEKLNKIAENEKKQAQWLRYFYNSYKDGDKQGMKKADVFLEMLYQEFFILIEQGYTADE